MDKNAVNAIREACKEVIGSQPVITPDGRKVYPTRNPGLRQQALEVQKAFFEDVLNQDYGKLVEQTRTARAGPVFDKELDARLEEKYIGGVK